MLSKRAANKLSKLLSRPPGSGMPIFMPSEEGVDVDESVGVEGVEFAASEDAARGQWSKSVAK